MEIARSTWFHWTDLRYSLSISKWFGIMLSQAQNQGHQGVLQSKGWLHQAPYLLSIDSAAYVAAKHDIVKSAPTHIHEKIRHDRYEGKPLYWVEEEVEVEYEKVASRTRSEQGEYQVSADLADAMAASDEALQLDMAAIGGGKCHPLG